MWFWPLEVAVVNHTGSGSKFHRFSSILPILLRSKLHTHRTLGSPARGTGSNGIGDLTHGHQMTTWCKPKLCQNQTTMETWKNQWPCRGYAKVQLRNDAERKEWKWTTPERLIPAAQSSTFTSKSSNKGKHVAMGQNLLCSVVNGTCHSLLLTITFSLHINSYRHRIPYSAWIQ